MGFVASVARETRAVFGGARGRSLGAIALTWGTLLGTRMIYPVLLPYFRSSFDLSLTIAGFLVTILWLGSALGQLPGGLLADRFSERSVMIASTGFVSIAVVGVVIAWSPLVLFVATAFIGLGQSLYPIARITILSKIYPDRIGSALGVTMATGDLGQTVFPPVAGTLAAAIAWQAGLTFLVPLLLLSGIALWITLPGRTGTDGSTDPDESAGTISIETGRRVFEALKQPDMRLMGLILFLYIFIWQSFTGLYPTYLVEEKGLSSSMAGLLFSLFFAVGVIVKPVSGAAYDRIGMRLSLIGVLLGPIIGFALLPVVDRLWHLMVLTVLVSTMLGSGAITQSFLADAFPESVRGTGLGTIRTVVATLGAAGPVVFAAIADRGFFDEGYFLLAGIMVVIVLLTARTSPAGS
ncbi:MAG: MFS transporter [Natronomonas sp.]